MRLRSLPGCSLSLLLLLFVFSQSAATQSISNRYIQPAQQNIGLITPTTPTGGRTIKFVNSCPFAVWLGAVGGDAGKTCTRDADCGVSRGCGTNRRCFWIMPQPKSGWWVLLPKGQRFFTFGSTATFQFPDTGAAQRWNGKFYPRTGCKFSGSDFVCDTGSCNQIVCNDPGVGPVGAGPYTLIEFDLENASTGINYDTYDIGLIHGMNVPADIKPDPAGTYPAGTGQNAMYWCGAAAGNPASSGELTACTYKFTPGEKNYLTVTGGGNLCATDEDCATGQKCGLARQSVTPPMSTTNWGKLTCGVPIGWWSPTAICGENPSFGSPHTTLFNCTQPVGGGYGTLSNVYQCGAGSTGSCYGDKAQDTCCGCKDWPYPAFPKCQNFNTTWGTEVAPKIQFIKNACPTAYSYQYDDKTVTFTCNTTSKPNTANYIVTLCPGGNTGLPSTTPDD